MQKKEDVSHSEAPPRKEVAGSDDWMQFPTLTEVFMDGPEKTIACMTQKHREYRRQMEVGLAADRAKAGVIAEGYAHTAALLREIETARLEQLKKEATMAVSPR